MKRRWYNIFNDDGRSFVLAMDHAMLMHVAEAGLQDPRTVLEAAVAGGVDAVLTTFGVAEHYQKEIGSIGLILRIDGGTTCLHPSGNIMDQGTQTFTVEDAVRMGADGVMCMGFPGLENESAMARMLAHNASECKKWGMVYGVEMMPGGFINDEIKTVENIMFADRLGAEYGADFVKSLPVSDPAEFRKVIHNCYKPILVLGGGGARTDRELLQMIRDAIDAGAKGVTIGRNIWKHQSVEKLCRAITMVIHEDASVEQALEIL